MVNISDTVAILSDTLILALLTKAILTLSKANLYSISANFVRKNKTTGIKLFDTVLFSKDSKSRMLKTAIRIA